MKIEDFAFVDFGPAVGGHWAEFSVHLDDKLYEGYVTETREPYEAAEYYVEPCDDSPNDSFPDALSDFAIEAYKETVTVEYEVNEDNLEKMVAEFNKGNGKS